MNKEHMTLDELIVWLRKIRTVQGRGDFPVLLVQTDTDGGAGYDEFAVANTPYISLAPGNEWVLKFPVNNLEWMTAEEYVRKSVEEVKSALVFKVVRPKLQDDGATHLKSTVRFRSPDAEVEYKPGVTAVSSNGTPLLAFATLGNARDFARASFGKGAVEVWKAEATDVRPIETLFRIYFSSKDEEVVDWWERRGFPILKGKRTIQAIDEQPAPNGTVACSSITLIERVPEATP